MSVIADFQVRSASPSVIPSSTSTAVQYFTRTLSGRIGFQSTAPSATSAAGQLLVPGNNALNGQMFDVRANGDFGSDSGDPSGTVTIQLFANIGSVASPNYISLATTGVITPGYASAESWSIVASLQGTTNSGIVGGTYTAIVDGAVVGTADQNISSTLNNINFSNLIPFGFVVGVQFGTGDLTNKASLYQFQITQPD
jgi:hypothetical protein